jgi:hypothetical protein
MTSALNGRISRLEFRVPTTTRTSVCARCGLPHVGLPIPLDLAQTIVRPGLGSREPAPPRLCLCLDCCADGHDLARLTHGSPIERAAI